MSSFSEWRTNKSEGGAATFYSKRFATENLENSRLLYQSFSYLLSYFIDNDKLIIEFDNLYLSISLKYDEDAQSSIPIEDLCTHIDQNVISSGLLSGKKLSVYEDATNVAIEARLYRQAFVWLDGETAWKQGIITASHEIMGKNVPTKRLNVSLTVSEKIMNTAKLVGYNDILLVADPEKLKIFLHLHTNQLLAKQDSEFAAQIDKILLSQLRI